jgi:purine-nucleoside phosphorylase
MDAAAVIRERVGADPVGTAVILGSGLGHLAGAVEGVSIPYADLPEFPEAGVSGHMAVLTVGDLEGVRVAVLGGRAHYYERGDPAVMRPVLVALKGIGVERLILTNAAGSLRNDVAPGEILLISDHMNLSGANPLIGEATDKRFVNMVDAYDPTLRQALLAAAREGDVPLAEGVYAWLSGPSFETPAEIRALRVLGADAVGMSTVPEVLLARFLEMRVAAISSITNMAAGLGTDTISHEQTKAVAPLGARKLERVLRHFLRRAARTA